MILTWNKLGTCHRPPTYNNYIMVYKSYYKSIPLLAYTYTEIEVSRFYLLLEAVTDLLSYNLCIDPCICEDEIAESSLTLSISPKSLDYALSRIEAVSITSYTQNVSKLEKNIKPI